MEYEGALYCLHRYFDNCIESTTIPTSPDTTQPQSLLPFSVLNLAVLHFYFGHIEEATLVRLIYCLSINH